jgi:hypothetical protein
MTTVDRQSPIALDTVVGARLEHGCHCQGIETVAVCMASSVWYQPWVAAEEMSARLPMSRKERRTCLEEAVVAVGEGAWAELQPWRGLFDRWVDCRYANGWHVLQEPRYSPCEPQHECRRGKNHGHKDLHCEARPPPLENAWMHFRWTRIRSSKKDRRVRV